MTMHNREQAEAFEHYRVLLFTLAYRMTGSASDAEDLVQETYLRYQASKNVEIVSLKPYLTTILTRLTLNYLHSAHVVREQYVGVWLPEPLLTSEDAGLDLEQHEALSLAFLHLLEALSPPERAVFLLHEVFGYPFREIASILLKSPSNCRQIFHRARQALQDRHTRFEPEPGRQRQLLHSFLAASQTGNMKALIDMLAQEVISWSDGGGKVQTNILPLYGKLAVARFWSGVMRKMPRPLTFTFAEINGSQAILCWDENNLVGVIGMSCSAASIEEIYALLNPEKLTYLRKQFANRASTYPGFDL